MPDEPLAVLHVDAHADLNVPGDRIPAGTGWLGNAAAADPLLKAADLANFQLSAVW